MNVDDARAPRTHGSAADALAGRMALLEVLFSEVPVGIAIVDRQFRCLQINEALATMNGVPAADHIGRTPREVIPGVWPLIEPMYHAVLRGEAVRSVALSHRLTPDAPLIHQEVSFFPLTLDGTVAGFGVVVADVTERHELELRVRQSQKMEAVGQLASGIAHDFNNLLTVIDMCSEMLVTSTPASHPSHELAVEILRAGERAGQLTRQLLAFSRRQVVAPRVLDLNTVVADSEKLLRRLISEHIILVTNLKPGLWPVFADAGQLEQVLINLAVNARDAMPSQGQLTIATSMVTLDTTDGTVPPGDFVLLEIRDDGIGMDATVLAQIFEPFFTTKGAGKGTGLGLATVHSIVERANGFVTVDSAPGAGTAFRIHLPRCAPDDAEATPRHTTDLPRGTETILLAEDDPALRMLARRMLEACGYSVLAAADGREALEFATTYPGTIDLLVSDVVMPHLGGRQLAEAVNLVRPDCKVLFVSGYTDDDVLLHGVVHSEVAMLQKPYTMSVLAQKVRAVLDG